MGNAGKAVGKVAAVMFLTGMGGLAGLVLGCAGAFAVIFEGDRYGWTPKGDASVGFGLTTIVAGLSIGGGVGAAVAGAVAVWIARGGREDAGGRACGPAGCGPTTTGITPRETKT